MIEKRHDWQMIVNEKIIIKQFYALACKRLVKDE
jgi:hypothetical protein